MPKAERFVTKVFPPDPLTLLLPEGVPYPTPPGEAGVNELKQVSSGLVNQGGAALFTVEYSNGDVEVVSLQSMNQPVEVRKEMAKAIHNLFLIAAQGEMDDGSDPDMVDGPDNILQLIPGGVLKPEAEAGRSIIMQLLAYVDGPTFGATPFWAYGGNDRSWAVVDPEKATMLEMGNDTGLAIRIHAEAQ